jgi:hypothetical protein
MAKKELLPAPALAPSFLQAAFDATERGDVVLTRALVKKVDPSSESEIKAAVLLSKELSSTENTVAADPKSVGQALVLRSVPPGKSYVFVALCFAILVILVSLAAVRYKS